MRIRYFVTVGSAAFVTAAFAIEACGGDATTEPIAADAAAEAAPVVDSGPTDTGAPDVEVDAATCDLSTNLTSGIPDASIADGASTTGVCLGCVSAKCKTSVDKCNLDCTCKGLANTALDCYTKTPDPIACGAGFVSAKVPSSTRNIGISLFQCVAQSCKSECATGSFDAGF